MFYLASWLQFPFVKLLNAISRPGGTAGWLWNFRLDDVGRWHDSELPSLGGQLDHNDPGLQLEEFTSRFQCKKTDSEAAGHHKTTGPPNALARRTRLRPRATESSPRAGSRQPRLTDCSAAAAPLPRPSAGETTSRAGHWPPNGPDAGLGMMPHHSDRRGQLDPRAARLRHEPLG